MLQFFRKLFPQKIKNLYHLVQAVLASFWFGFPGKKIKIIGVTGTNGKTTTCQMIACILEEAGKKVALSSTINFKIDQKKWTNKTKFTTRSAWETQKFIARAVKADCEYLVLEVSSHSLDQNRLWGIDFAVAVITNITREHLDYHQTMEHYKNAKLKLFQKASLGIVNLKMDWAEEFLNCGTGEKGGYFLEISNFKLSAQGGPASGWQIPNEIQNTKYQTIKAEDLELGKDFSKFSVDGVGFEVQFLGEFNVENALAAIATGLSQGIDLMTMKKALEKMEGVAGRMEEIANDRGIKIIVDYAVTPDSMEKLGALAQKLKEEDGKIIWVFGACGERDKGKRPMMGAIGARFADLIIITNEDPYFEDANKIIDEVFVGVIGTKFQIQNNKFQINSKFQNPKKEIEEKRKQKIEGENCWRIFDRREAIAKALSLAGKGDLVLVTGKGAEETMAVKEERIPWNDRKVIEEELGRFDQD